MPWFHPIRTMRDIPMRLETISSTIIESFLDDLKYFIVYSFVDALSDPVKYFHFYKYHDGEG